MGIRRQSRETALLMLYLCDICKYTDDDALHYLLHIADLPQTGHAFARELFTGTRAHARELDTLITGHAENWDLDRMAAVDRNLIRMAAYELTAMPETPVNVIIDEAVEIAKHFSTADSSKFVNGILDKLKSERRQASPADAPDRKPAVRRKKKSER